MTSVGSNFLCGHPPEPDPLHVDVIIIVADFITSIYETNVQDDLVTSIQQSQMKATFTG